MDDQQDLILNRLRRLQKLFFSSSDSDFHSMEDGRLERPNQISSTQDQQAVEEPADLSGKRPPLTDNVLQSSEDQQLDEECRVEPKQQQQSPMDSVLQPAESPRLGPSNESCNNKQCMQRNLKDQKYVPTASYGDDSEIGRLLIQGIKNNIATQEAQVLPSYPPGFANYNAAQKATVRQSCPSGICIPTPRSQRKPASNLPYKWSKFISKRKHSRYHAFFEEQRLAAEKKDLDPFHAAKAASASLNKVLNVYSSTSPSYRADTSIPPSLDNGTTPLAQGRTMRGRPLPSSSSQKPCVAEPSIDSGCYRARPTPRSMNARAARGAPLLHVLPPHSTPFTPKEVMLRSPDTSPSRYRESDYGDEDDW